MKKFNKIVKATVCVAIGTLLVQVKAQNAVAPTASPVNSMNTASSTTTVTTVTSPASNIVVSSPLVVSPSAAASSVSPGNTYEKEVTPLLREVSRKKSILELKKLDRELEKLDEEGLKAQADREKASQTPVSTALPFTPQIINPTMTPSMLPSLSTPSSATKEIKVFMVYGYDNSLYAKVGYGSQGGYVVKKGDTLPDGRVVSVVTPNFIEVMKVRGNKKGVDNIDKIFVTGPAVEAVMPMAATAYPSIAPSQAPNMAILAPAQSNQNNQGIFPTNTNTAARR